MNGKALKVLIVFLSMLLLSSMFGVRLTKTVRASTTNHACPNWLRGWTHRKQLNISGSTPGNVTITVYWGSGEALIVAGGKPDQETTGKITEAWLVDINHVIKLPNMSNASNAGSAAVYNNKLYCFGGHWASRVTQIFDATTWSWNWGTELPEGRRKLARRVPVVDDTVHIFGGAYGTPATRRKTHWIYNITSNSWTNSTAMNKTRSSPFVGYDGNTNFYVVGGSADEKDGRVNWNHKWNATDDVWRNAKNHPYKITDGVGLNYQGKLWCIGGWTDTPTTKQVDYVYSYNYSTDSWTKEKSLPLTLAHLSGDVIRNRIYVCCGDSPPGTWRDRVYYYSPLDSQWHLDSRGKLTARGSPLVGALNLSDHEGHVFLNNKSCTDFGDVRFTASDGSTLLSYWIKDKTDSKYATFVVNVSSVPTPDGIIYIYYGKSGVPVGGIWIPVDKFGLLAPYIALAPTIIVATAATAIYIKHRKKKQ